MAYSSLKQECSRCVWSTSSCQKEAPKDSGHLLTGQRKQLQKENPHFSKLWELSI